MCLHKVKGGGFESLMDPTYKLKSSHKSDFFLKLCFASYDSVLAVKTSWLCKVVDNTKNSLW